MQLRVADLAPMAFVPLTLTNKKLIPPDYRIYTACGVTIRNENFPIILWLLRSVSFFAKLQQNNT